MSARAVRPAGAPREVVFRGVVVAAGVAIDPACVGERTARRRVLDLWSPATTVDDLGGVYLVRWPQPRWLSCDRSPGAPVVLREGRLLAAPLSDDELASVESGHGAVVRVVAGRLQLDRPQASVDPAIWLDVSATRVIAMAPLLDTLPRRRLLVPAGFDARRQLGVPAAEARAIELARGLQAGVGAARRGVRGAIAAVAQVASSLAGAIQGWLRRRPRAAVGSIPAGTDRGTGGSLGVNGAPPRSWRQRLGSAVSDALLGGWLSWAQDRLHGEYLQRLLKILRGGDLDAFLKNAISLGAIDRAAPGRSSPLSSPLSALALWLFQRSSFAIDTSPDRPARSVNFGAGLFDLLTDYYRSMVARLEQQGRIEQAAFVLTELLNAHEEAVAFLERHGKLRLAAELAEGKELAPGLVVRAWFVAGDIPRAVRVAVRHQAFADAIARLEQQPRQAAALRLLWAEHLAGAGDYPRAIEVIWPLTAERHRARGWLDAVIDEGGVAGARMLGRAFALFPDRMAELRERALTLICADAAAAARLAFAVQLAKQPTSEAVPGLARATTRALVRDGADRAVLLRVAARSEDPTLQADLPPLRRRTSPPAVLRHAVEPGDVGPSDIRDLVITPGGRLLVALGEAGVLELDRHGRPVRRYDVPAARLVAADHGHRLIAVARRGIVRRLSRIDLDARRAADWCDVRLSRFAPDYDGELWIVADGDELLAIDAQAREFVAAWHVTEVDPVHIARSPTSLTMVTGSRELWHYRLPGFFLRERDSSAPGRDATPIAAIPGGGQVELFVDAPLAAPGRGEQHASDDGFESERADPESAHADPQPEAMRLRSSLWPAGRTVPWDGDTFTTATTTEHIAVATARADPGLDSLVAVRVLTSRTAELRLELLLGGVDRCAVRLTADHLVVGDGRGRLLVVDLASNRLTCDLRV